MAKYNQVDVNFTPLKSWSYSKYSCYKLCAYQFYCKYILKLPQGPAPAMERGIKIHQEGEDYLMDKVQTVPASYKKLSTELKTIKKKGYVAEEAWGFTKDWTPVPFFDNRAFLRMKIDAHGFPEERIGKVIDFKTGKVRNYNEQNELYDIAMLTVYDLDEVRSEFWFLDQGEISDEVTHTAGRYESLVKRWDRKIAPMFNDTKFAPTPNYLCKNYCDFSRTKSGHCRHG